MQAPIDSPSPCPDDDLLDAWARGVELGPDPRCHIEGCARCMRAIAEIQENNDFLARMAPAVRDRLGAAVSGLAPDESVPGYQIIRELSRGGQGIVYQAIQSATRRTVALKLPVSGNLATARQRHRFEREIEIIAGLRHPHIVTLFGAETLEDGRTLLVMEYVEGEPLDQWAAGNGAGEGKTAPTFSRDSKRSAIAGNQGPCAARRPSRNLLELFVKICDAVNFAHQRGVIHRDLKPANILVADGHEGTKGPRERGNEDAVLASSPPSVSRSLGSSVPSSAEPRILDFGLAKAIGDDPLSATPAATQAGEFMGTLAYAAPESVVGDPKGIDTRTDVYALGVMLHEALTGQLPYPMSGSLVEGVRSIIEVEPGKPSLLAAGLDDELDTIVLKALAKAKERRYQSAHEMAQDLARYLAGEPIHAKSDSAWYFIRKTTRRYRWPLAAAAAFVVLLAGFAVAMSIQAGRIAAQRNDLAESLAESNIERGRMIGVTGTLPAAETLLWREFLLDPGPMEAGLNGSATYWAVWELYSRQPCLAAMRGAAPGQTPSLPISFSADSRRMLSCMTGDAFGSWAAPSGRPLATRSGPALTCRGISAGPDGEILALSQADGVIVLWDMATGRSTPLPTTDLGGVSCLTFSRDGRTVALGGQHGRVQLHQVATGAVQSAWAAHEEPVTLLGFSPDGASLATYGGAASTVRVWDTPSGAVRREWKTDSHLYSLSFSPDARTLAYPDPEHEEVIVWDIEAQGARARVASRVGQIHSLAFSPDGRTLAAGGFNGALGMIDVASESWSAMYAAHAGDIGSIRFSPDGQWVATAGLDGLIRLWELPPAGGRRELSGPRDTVLSVGFSPCGRFVAAACGKEGVVQLWDVASGRIERGFEKTEAAASAVAFDPSGQTLAAGGQDGVVRLWEVASGTLRARFTPNEKIAHLAFSPDGRRLATSGESPVVSIWDVTALPREVLRLEGHIGRVPCVAWSPNGKSIVTAGRDMTVIMWDGLTGRRRFTLSGHQGPVRRAQFSPDGGMLLTSSDDQTVKLWEAAAGRCIRTLSGHTGQVWSACFSPDGRLAASGDHGGGIRLWDVATGRLLATLESPGPVYDVSFSPDGRTLAAGCDRPMPLMLCDLTYYDRHIAGNLEYQIHRVGIDTLDPDRIARLRAWTGEVLADNRTPHGSRP